MRLRTLLILAFFAALTAMNTGCPMAPVSTETLDNIESLPDDDGDGFHELESPEGLEEAETIAVSIINEITRADAVDLAAELFGGGLEGLLNLVGITVEFEITRVYEGGERITDKGSRNLEPFDDITVEAACPESVIAAVDVIATVPIPLVPPFSVLGQPQTFTLTLGDGPGERFACGQVITVRAFVDESGQPRVNTTIEDQ